MGSELLAGFVLGVASGLITNYLWERRRPFTFWVSELVVERTRPAYDSHHDRIYAINRWSTRRELEPDRLLTKFTNDRPRQTIFAQDKLDREVARQDEAGHDGSVCYVIDARVDHRESPATEKFHVTLARSRYAEQVAVMNLLGRDEEAQRRVYALLAREPRRYLRAACPTSVVANVVVHSPGGRLLAVRRSGAVDTAGGLWTLGIFETMILEAHHTKGEREDLFSLCERGLREEVGLERGSNYERIMISWFGVYGPLLRTHVVAHARTTINESSVIGALEHSEGLYEADAYDWVQPSRQNVRSIMDASMEEVDTIAPRFAALGRSWLNQTKLALYESHRVRAAI